MLRTTLAEIRAHPTRLLGVLLAVALSVAFVVACLVFVDTESAGLQRSVAARTSGSSVVVTPVDDRDLAPTIAETAGVETVERSRSHLAGLQRRERAGSAAAEHGCRRTGGCSG